MTIPKAVVLRPRKDKQLGRGYPWIFRDQVQAVEGGAVTGDAVRILDANGVCRGQGLFHERSLIQVRFLTTDPGADPDALLAERVRRAVAGRDRVYGPDAAVRLIHGEADGVPGTFVDRYADVLAFSTICAGIEQRRETLLDALEECCRPRAIVERNDHWLRGKDELPERRSVLRGSAPGPVEIDDEGLTFLVDVMEGPKTGFFLDQREHRRLVGRHAAGRRVLDAFCADGGFALHAARGGAAEVTGLDVSDAALARARSNAERNQLSARVTFAREDLLDTISARADAGERYDLVVLDPPAFARSRRHLDAARRAYQLLNVNALRLLPPGGLLATSSCSTALDEKEFWKILLYSARKAGAAVRLLVRGSQPADHPSLPTMPETSYLKFFLLERISDEVPPVGGPEPSARGASAGDAAEPEPEAT